MKFDFTPLDISVAEPFMNHKGVTTNVRQIAVRLTHNGLSSFGVALVSKDYMQEEELISALQIQANAVEKISPIDIEFVLNKAKAASPNSNAALCAIDMALYDWCAKHENITLSEFLGINTLQLPETAISIGLGPVSEVIEKVLLHKDWPILKLKMSEPDLDLIETIHSNYSGKIWIDANGAWSIDETISISNFLMRHGVELIEQPIRSGKYEKLKFIRDNCSLKIFADEDITSLHDIPHLVGCVDGVNLKLHKCGGISETLKIIGAAKSFGLKIMLGCKTESSIGVTAMAHIAGLSDFVDLDGYFDLANDPFTGMKVNNGYITLPTAPGLGVIYTDKFSNS